MCCIPQCLSNRHRISTVTSCRHKLLPVCFGHHIDHQIQTHVSNSGLRFNSLGSPYGQLGLRTKPACQNPRWPHWCVSSQIYITLSLLYCFRMLPLLFCMENDKTGVTKLLSFTDQWWTKCLSMKIKRHEVPTSLKPMTFTAANTMKQRTLYFHGPTQIHCWRI